MGCPKKMTAKKMTAKKMTAKKMTVGSMISFLQDELNKGNIDLNTELFIEIYLLSREEEYVKKYEKELGKKIQTKDVHTEHCCIHCGCKYGEESFCSVFSGIKRQSYPCNGDCNKY